MIDVAAALSRGPARAEVPDGRPVLLFNTLWRHPADGWAIASRAYARAMRAGGIDVRLTQWAPDEGPLDPEVVAEVAGLNGRYPAEWDAYVFSSTLRALEHMGPPLQTLLKEKAPRAYYCVFERRFVEPGLAALLGQFDGVWVQCRMNRDVLVAAGCENVTLIPYPYFDDDPHLSIAPPRSSRRFYYIGRFEPRKAPDNVVRAFLRAFRPGEAELTVKTSPIPWLHAYPGPKDVLLDELAVVEVAANGWTARNWRESIRIVTGRLSAREMVALHAEHDVYVTASRGEGLELGAFAAKLAGRRMIATESGGPQDFMGEHDVLVPSKGLVPADPRYGWGDGATYVDYSLDDLVAAMQRVRSEPPRGGHWPTMVEHRAERVGAALKGWVDKMPKSVPTPPPSMRRRHALERRSRSALVVKEADARVLDLFDLALDPRDKSLTPSILQYGFWESWVTLAFMDFVKPGMVTVDAGAHCGYFTMLLASIVGPGGRVHAVEPNVNNLRLLRRSIDLNGFGDRVVLDERAVWDEGGVEMELSIPGSLTGSASLVGHGPPPKNEEVTKQRVVTATLDEILAGAVADFVKIDCEGAEARIWEGMRQTWRRSDSIVVCAEFAPSKEHVDFVEHVKRDGGRVRIIDFTGEVKEMPRLPDQLSMLWITK